MDAMPTDVTVRMYQVAFGDTYLVSIRYGRGEERHLLIDFGQKSGVRDAPGRPEIGPRALVATARSIAQRVGDAGLAAVVVTHRHEDHLGGFAVDEAAEIIAGLHPQLVVRPWTEDPAAPRDAGKPSGDPRRFMAGLDAAAGFAEALAFDPFPAARTVAGRETARLAAAQIPNRRAIENLEALGAAGRAEYLAAPRPAGPPVQTALTELLPGVRVDVLGPPMPDVWPRIRQQREDDPDYWISMTRHLAGAIGLRADGHGDARAPLDGAAREGEADEMTSMAPIVEAGPTRWLVEHLQAQQVRSVLRIVRWLDRSLNNTSLVLLLRVGDRRLLFPGDAQIESWLYALEKHPDVARIGEDLDALDLYKVGHHGSRNATPVRVYERWKQRPPERPLVALMSTLRDVYGESDGTRVPNARLVSAFDRPPFSLLSSESLPLGSLFLDVRAPAEGPGAFHPV